MEATLMRPTEESKEKRKTNRLSGSFKKLRIKAKDRFSRGGKTTVTVEEVPDDLPKAIPVSEDPQPKADEEDKLEKQRQEIERKEQEQKEHAQQESLEKKQRYEQWQKELNEGQDRLDSVYRQLQIKEQQNKQQGEREGERFDKDVEIRRGEEVIELENLQAAARNERVLQRAKEDYEQKQQRERQRELEPWERDLQIQRRMEERIEKEKQAAIRRSHMWIQSANEFKEQYQKEREEAAKRWREQRERDQELQRKMEERVREEKLRAAAEGTKETSRPIFTPYTVSDLERERFQRMVLGMDSHDVARSNDRGRRNYDVEVLW
jgi:hypothetical protein